MAKFFFVPKNAQIQMIRCFPYSKFLCIMEEISGLFLVFIILFKSKNMRAPRGLQGDQGSRDELG